MQYRTCPFCGANLDPGERCDCQEEKRPIMREPQQTAREKVAHSVYQRRAHVHAGQRR